MTMKKLMVVGFAVLALMGARAADVYVAETGNDDNSGADEWHPMQSINAAISKLGEEGGRILLASGTYKDEVPVIEDADRGPSAVVLNSPIVIEGRSGNPADVTIQRTAGNGTFRAFYLNNANAAVKNITIRDFAAVASKPGGGVFIGAQGGLVENCNIVNCKAGENSRESGGGGVYMTGGRVVRSLIEKCYSNNMRQYGSGVYASAGVIEQCVIRECKTTHHASACNGNGAVAIKGSAVLINSVVVNNTSCLATGVFVDDWATGGVFNTIVYGNKLCGSSHTDGCTRFNGIFCARMGNTSIYPALVKNKSTIGHCAVDSTPYNDTCIPLEASPFTDYANKNYLIPDDSPLADAGNSDKAADHVSSEYDYYGKKRISGTRIDIGVAEVQKAGLYISDVTTSSDFAILPDDAVITFTVAGFSSTGNISYTWDFGDGSDPVSTSENTITHAYTDAGSYTVLVVAANETDTFEYAYPNKIGVSGLSVSYSRSSNQGREGVPLTFEAEVLASSDTVTFTWDFGDGSDKLVTTDLSVSHTYAVSGQYMVRVSAKSLKDAEVTYVFPDKMMIVRENLYVRSAGSDTFPYDTWEKAATTPQTAIDAAVDGCTVHVAPATYNVQNKTVKVNKNIVLCGEGDTPAQTIFDGRSESDSGTQNMSVNAAGAFVKNLTLYRGFSGGSPGGGNLALYDGIVSNCVLSSGRTRNMGAESGGAKVMGGILTHCIITNAYNGNRGAGICLVQTAGRVSNCLITRNKRSWDDSRQAISLCAVSGGVIDNCTIADCWILKNNPNNKLQMGTSSDSPVKVSGTGKAYNLTIADIRWDIVPATDEDRDELLSRLEKPKRWAGTAASFVSCATDDATPINDTCFVGTLEKGSLFADYENKDLTPGAVTKNRGAASGDFAFPAGDLAGNPRMVGKAIDIGCYERQLAKGFGIIVR